MTPTEEEEGVTKEHVSASNHREIRDWIVANYQSLIVAIEKSEGCKDKLEAVNDLLISVNATLDVLRDDEVGTDEIYIRGFRVKLRFRNYLINFVSSRGTLLTSGYV